MKYPRKGSIVAVSFLDHVEDGIPILWRWMVYQQHEDVEFITRKWNKVTSGYVYECRVDGGYTGFGSSWEDARIMAKLNESYAGGVN